MIRFLPVVTALLLAPIAAGEEFQELTSETIGKIPGYQFVPQFALRPVSLPKEVDSPQVHRQRRSRLEMATRRMAKRFGIIIDVPLECRENGDGRTMVSPMFYKPDGDIFWVNFNSADEAISFYCHTRAGLPLDGLRKVTPDAFGEYARECHRLAFGFSPDGALLMDDEGRGLTGRMCREEAEWELKPNGVNLNSNSFIRAGREKDRSSLNGIRGSSATLIGDIRQIMENYPTRVTPEWASMIAWKNWIAACKEEWRPPHDVYTIRCHLRECRETDLDPWSDTYGWTHEKAAWLDPEYEVQLSDTVCYEVTISDGLFRVRVLVDRLNGKIVRMNQSRMTW